MSWLHLTSEARQPIAHAPSLGHAKADARRNAPGSTVALAAVPERQLPAQSALGACAAVNQVGTGRFK